MKKGEIAGKEPSIQELKEGSSYAWCACGKSNSQPYCDGSHSSTDMRPVVFKSDRDNKVALCVCKQTNNPPYCDGSHTNL